MFAVIAIVWVQMVLTKGARAGVVPACATTAGVVWAGTLKEALLNEEVQVGLGPLSHTEGHIVCAWWEAPPCRATGGARHPPKASLGKRMVT